MAIQHRRGNYADFDKSKMVAGEFAVVLQNDPETSDGKSVYIAFNSGSAKRLMTKEDLQEGIEAATQEVVDAITEATAQDVEDAQTAATAAAESASEAASVIPELNQENAVAGTALQLMSSNYTTDSTPYLYRTTGGGVAVGTRELDEIVGGSVGWNQLARFPNGTSTVSGVTYTVTDGNKVAMSNTATADSILRGYTVSGFANHVYFVSGGKSNNIYVTATSSSNWARSPIDYGGGSIGKLNTDATTDFALVVKNGTATNMSIAVCATDLTLLLGSTIADYIYSLETATAGSGIAKLKEWGFFTQDYYAYDAGSLQSVTGVSAHEMTGKNLFDIAKLDFRETTTGGLTRVMQPDGTSFSLKGTSTTGGSVWGNPVDDGTLLLTAGTYIFSSTGHSSGLSLYFSDNTSQGEGTFTLAKDKVVTNVGIYVTNGATYNTIVYPLLRRAGTSDTYEPYTKHTYPLDSSLTLRGIPKLDSNNKLYFDGDVYASDGTVTRRYGIVDLGTLNWSLNEGQTNRFYAVLSGLKLADLRSIAFMCGRYLSNIGGGAYDDKTVYNAGNTAAIYVVDGSYSSAATFKTAMSGVYLVYPLATITTETADPYASVQICAEGGTEEYVTTGIVPVGHNTKYPADLAGKLDSIPALPTTAGNYRLKVTVTGGVPSYEWVTT